jgi:hypothetical protein
MSMMLLIGMAGPGEEARGDASSEHFRNDTSTSVRLLSVEDCQAFAVMMELEDDLEDSHVYFQIVARYTSMHQAEVTRVVTVRLPTTDSLSNYLQSVDDQIVWSRLFYCDVLSSCIRYLVTSVVHQELFLVNSWINA